MLARRPSLVSLKYFFKIFRSQALLRITQYSDDTVRSFENSIDFGPPRPSVGEGLGVRGRVHSWSFSQCSKIFIQSRVSGVDLAERYPPHPQPLSRVGARGADARGCAVSNQLVEVSL